MAAGAKDRRWQRKLLELEKDGLPIITPASGDCRVDVERAIAWANANRIACSLSSVCGNVIVLQDDDVEEVLRLQRHLQKQHDKQKAQARREWERQFDLDVDDLIDDMLEARETDY